MGQKRRVSQGIPAKVKIFFILSILLSITLFSLDPTKHLSQYLTDKWDIQDGLLSNTILSIAQTKDGYLWIATAKGLLRYDGIKFQKMDFYKQDSNTNEEMIADALLVTKSGILYIGSLGGVSSFNPKTGKIITLTEKNGIIKDRIRLLEEDKNGSIWISYFTNYVGRLTENRIISFNSSKGLMGNKINSIIYNSENNLLFATRENGIFLLKGENFTNYNIEGLENRLIISMIRDNEGETWIGTNHGLIRITPNKSQIYFRSDGLQDDYITSILEDCDKNLWVGTVKGLNRLIRESDGTVSIEKLFQGLTVTYLLEDQEKSIWVGTYESGLKRIKDGKFTPFIPYEKGMPVKEEMIISLFEDSHGNTWIGEWDGKLYRCRDGMVVETFFIPGGTGTGITAISEDNNGDLWIGTNGVGIFQKKKIQKKEIYLQYTKDEGLGDNIVTSIFKDSIGTMWFATFGGVSIWRDNRLETLKLDINNAPGKVIYNVYEDTQSNILVAGNKGVRVLKKDGISQNQMESYLLNIPVTCLYEDVEASETGNRVFWFATHGKGFKRLKNGKIDSFTTSEGMITDYLYQFIEDRAQNFWIMSDSGVLRVNKKQLERMADGKEEFVECTSFGLSDGLKSLEFNNEYSRHSALKTRNNELWLITRKGITVMCPDKITVNPLTPSAIIESVVFDDTEVDCFPEAGINEFKGARNLRFSFTAPTFLSPGKIKFKFRMEGVDKKWNLLPPGKERIAHYTDLSPGLYTFHVMASNSEGVWNPEKASIAVNLKPFFYETFIFKIIILLSSCGIGFMYYYFHKKRMNEKKVKYKGTPINPQFADELIKKLVYLMESKKLFREPDISLQGLAEKLSISPHMLSQLLNETLNHSFSDYINYFRVEEAKQILSNPSGKNQKIAFIASDVGFNTQVAFYNAFKKFTNMTPAQFKKNEEKKKEK